LASSPPNSIVIIKLEKLAQNQSLLSFTQDFEQIPLDMESRTKAWEHMFQKMANQILK